MSKSFVKYVQNAEKNIVSVSLYYDYSDNEHQKMLSLFGDVEVELGGTITVGMLTFTIPSNKVKFPSRLPVTQSFDGASEATPADAVAKALAWRSFAITQITNALQTQWTNTESYIDFNVEDTSEITTT